MKIALLTAAFLLIAAVSAAQELRVSAEGTTVKIAAIGGETTGTGLLQEGNVVGQVDFKSSGFPFQVDQKVRIKGYYKIAYGVTSGHYLVLVATDVELLDTKE